jgi:RimJ/RimL family protein N-acetyltransferase
MILETERLILRPWRDEDREPYARFNADPVTRRFYPEVLDAAQTFAGIDSYIAAAARDGFGFYAVERKIDRAFMGDVGLSRVPEVLSEILPGKPSVEVGWFLGREFWGRGYAPEAAKAWIDYGFRILGLSEIVAFTSRLNRPSLSVMEKVGMARDLSADFDHPRIPVDHPLRPHLLYRLNNPGF